MDRIPEKRTIFKGLQILSGYLQSSFVSSESSLTCRASLQCLGAIATQQEAVPIHLYSTEETLRSAGLTWNNCTPTSSSLFLRDFGTDHCLCAWASVSLMSSWWDFPLFAIYPLWAITHLLSEFARDFLQSRKLQYPTCLISPGCIHLALRSDSSGPCDICLFELMAKVCLHSSCLTWFSRARWGVKLKCGKPDNRKDNSVFLFYSTFLSN